MTAGNIVVASGLDCVSGDSLVASEAAGSVGQELLGATSSLIPDPVFFCSIESPSPSKQKQLELGLRRLSREDPGLRVRVDDSGQIVLSGMGQLHLEVLRERLAREYDVDAHLGPLQVAYRESIRSEVRESISLSKTIAGVSNSVSLTLVLKPSVDQEDLVSADAGRIFASSSDSPVGTGSAATAAASPLKVVVSKENELGKLRQDHRRAIENGITSAFACGPLLNFPVIGVTVELHELSCSRGTTAAFLSSVTSTCVSAGLKGADAALLEPVMRIEITVPVSHSGKIVADLANRRSHLQEVSERSGVRLIRCLTPLAQLALSELLLARLLL